MKRSGEGPGEDIPPTSSSPVPKEAVLLDQGERQPEDSQRELPGGDQLILDEMLVAVHGASSGIVEDLRVIRTKIVHPADGAPLPKTILITSSVPGEGKTFLAANLGITMAQSLEHHVLIVEADIRRPSVAKLLGLSNERGLVNYLQGEAELGALLQKTAFEKLSVLPSGPVPINPAELLDSTRMEAMLAELAQRYSDRLVIIDSPPLNVASETAVLAKFADQVLFVVRSGLAGRGHVKKAVESIDRQKIIGIIFNAVPKSGVREKYRDYYSYYDYRAQPFQEK